MKHFEVWIPGCSCKNPNAVEPVGRITVRGGLVIHFGTDPTLTPRAVVRVLESIAPVCQECRKEWIPHP